MCVGQIPRKAYRERKKCLSLEVSPPWPHRSTMSHPNSSKGQLLLPPTVTGCDSEPSRRSLFIFPIIK